MFPLLIEPTGRRKQPMRLDIVLIPLPVSYNDSSYRTRVNVVNRGNAVAIHNLTVDAKERIPQTFGLGFVRVPKEFDTVIHLERNSYLKNGCSLIKRCVDITEQSTRDYLGNVGIRIERTHCYCNHSSSNCYVQGV